MGAITKHFHKVLAGLLCVCLLLSYNPAFGAVDTAFAANDGGTHLDSGITQDDLNAGVASGGVGVYEGAADDQLFNETNDMTTHIQASTFDGSLKTNRRDSFSATVDQLKSGKAGDTDVSYIWFEVTGGTPSAGDDPYNATWQVFDNDEASTAINDWLKRPGAINVTKDGNVVNYHVNVQALAQSGLLLPNHKYAFVGTFTDADGKPTVERVTLYTVNDDKVNFQPSTVKGEGDLKDVEIDGMIQKGTELIGGKVPETNPVKEAMENEAAKETIEGPGGSNYVVGDVLQIGTNPNTIPGGEGLEIPPFDEDGFILRLPVDPNYIYSPTTNPNGYKEGDTIEILWSGDDSGKVEVIEAKIVVDDDGVMRAEVAYPYTGDADGDGVDDTGWPPLPGYFGVQYDTGKLPGGSNATADYFSITTDVRGNGIVTPEGTKYWRAKSGFSGSATASAIEQAMYGFAPMGFGEKSYELTGLTLECTSGSKIGTKYDFFTASNLSSVGTLSALKTTLTLTNAVSVFPANTAWKLTATFDESTMSDDDANGTHSLKVTSNNASYGKVLVAYNNENHETTMKPVDNQGNIAPSGSVEVNPMPNSSKATIIMVPSSPKDGKYYEVTGIEMKVGNGSFEPQTLEKPFIVPATTQNVEVKVVFEEFSDTGLGGETTYTATASVAAEDAELGSVVEGASVEYKENSSLIPTIVFEGVDEDKYLYAVDVFIGDRVVPERINVNAAGKQRYSLMLSNYHADIRVVGYFKDKNAPSIQLSIAVKTEGEADTAGGEYSLLGWTLSSPNMVRNMQRCPLLISPNKGYVLASVKETVGENDTDLTSQVAGGVLMYQPVDDRADTTEPLPIALTITFKKAEDTSGSLGDNADKKLSRVSMYVADASLAADGSGLSYMFHPEADKFTNDVAGENTATALSVQGYQAKTGLVNGQVSLSDTVKYGDRYPINMIGSTIGEQRYGIQKVLVVTYYYGADENGIQVKKGLSWKLYHTNVPVFELTNVTTHTDVIAYFAPIGNGTGGTTGDGGFDENKDYRNVTISSTPQGMVEPTGTVKVLKGSSLPVSFKVSTPEYVLASARVAANGTAHSIKDALTAAGTSNATYIVENIVEDTTVTATYDQRPEQDIVRHDVSADIQVKDGDETKPLGSYTMPCNIAVESGANFAQRYSVKNGENMGVSLMEGSDMRFSLTRRDGYYKLNNLSLVWDDAAVKAYRVAETQADGSVLNKIYFTSDESDLVGRQPYTSGTALYGDGIQPTDVKVEKSWYAYNLLCNVTLVPTYEKLEHQELPDAGDSWTLTTKVGSGLGQILVNSAEANGCITKVEKNSVSSDNPLAVSFVPATNYRIKDLHVNTSTGNALRDFWFMIEGILNAWGGNDLEQSMKDEAIANGSITLQGMVSNYEITVDFEPISNGEGDDTDPGTLLKDHVAVNVKYDADKGVVTPNTGLVVNRTAQQQFMATPNEVDEMFYSVTGVRVSVGDDVPEEVSPIDTDSDLVKWNSEFPNVFTVDFSQLAWPQNQPDMAVTVEVVFSDEPDVEKPDNSEPGTVPGTPSDSDKKQVVVNAVTEGVSEVGDNGIGGIVSPLGEFSLIPSKSGSAYKQRVDVEPSSDYRVSKIQMVRNGDAISGQYQAYEYWMSAKDNGYFEVEADEPGLEVITVYFALKPLSERSYTINVSAHVPDANRFIQPHGVTTVENTQSQTYSIDPDLNYQVASIEDIGLDADGNEVTLPADADGKRGANWTRTADDTSAVNELTINPIRVNGKVLNRRIVVTFEQKEGVDHGIVKSEKVNLHVQAYGPGSEYVSFDPDGDMIGVFKGTDTKHMSYTYRYSLSPDGIAAGYGIYRVQANGETVFGSPDNRTDLKQEGSFVFTTENMTRETNNLYVYVRKNASGGTENPGDTPGTTPGDNPGNNPGSQTKYVTVDYACGNGGSIVDKNPSVRVASNDSLLSGSLKVDPEEPFVLLITPDEGNVVDRIILDNCYIIEPNWVAPEDGRSAKIALESTMMVWDAKKSARVLVTFTKGDANTFVPWDATQENGHTYTVDSSFIVELTPADGVEALVDVDSGSAKAADMLSVSNPVAPFMPKSAKKAGSSSDAAGYTVTYDTISKLGTPNEVSIVVGPLIKWNDNNNAQSTLYTIDSVEGLKDFTIVEKPLPTAGSVENNDKPVYYTYYEIRGTLDDAATRNVSDAENDGAEVAEQAATPTQTVVRVGLRHLTFEEGVYPDYVNVVPAGKVQLRAQVFTGQGTIAPTTTTVGTSWYDGNLTGPWTVAEGSTVSFKVEPAAGFVLTGLTYNSVDALSNGAFDAETDTLTFKATSSTTIYASFSPKDSAEAMRTVTIEVQGGHGTTSPAPGTHQVEKGQPYSITFKADTGYVPYRIWVDGQESFVAPTLGGWMLPAWWHDQTFKVEYAVAGTTPSGLNYLVQTGQNVADQVGTSLVRTGDNPWLPVIVLLLLLAGGAAFGGMRLMHAGEAATRAAKYSVSNRMPRREEREEDKTVEVLETSETFENEERENE